MFSASPAGQSLTTTVILEQQNEEGSVPKTTISPPQSIQLPGFSERSNSQSGFLGMGMATGAIAAKNRGRRVSFGAIRAIPQNFNERKDIESGRGELIAASFTYLFQPQPQK